MFSARNIISWWELSIGRVFEVEKLETTSYNKYGRRALFSHVSQVFFNSVLEDLF